MLVVFLHFEEARHCRKVNHWAGMAGVDRLKSGIRYKVDQSHPSVAAVLANAGELQPLIQSMLRVIEETVPVQRIWLDTAENKTLLVLVLKAGPMLRLLKLRACFSMILSDVKVLALGRAQGHPSYRTIPKYPSLVKTLGVNIDWSTKWCKVN